VARHPTPPSAAQKTRADKVAVAAPLAEMLGCSLAELCRGKQGELHDARPRQKLDMPLAELCGDAAGSRPPATKRRRGVRGGCKQKAERDRKRAAAAFEQKQPKEDKIAEKPREKPEAMEKAHEKMDEEGRAAVVKEEAAEEAAEKEARNAVVKEEVENEVDEEEVDWTSQ